MEKMRDEENRGGQPHNNSASGRGRNEAPLGFEGMNFEQKRKPYRSATQSNKDAGQADDANNSGKRRDDL